VFNFLGIFDVFKIDSIFRGSRSTSSIMNFVWMLTEFLLFLEEDLNLADLMNSFPTLDKEDVEILGLNFYMLLSRTSKSVLLLLLKNKGC